MPGEVVPFYELVLDAGPSAPWIVMVHGVSQDRRVFSAQVRDFKRAYRLMLVDLPGHGRSGSIAGPYGLDEFASGIRAAVCHAGIARFHFWGTHIGASAGLLLATRDPDLFASLLLEGPVFPGRRLPAVSETIARVAATAREQGIEAARQLWWDESEWFAVMRARPAECRAAAQREIIGDFQGQPCSTSALRHPLRRSTTLSRDARCRCSS
jgi:3-oxoadipate enol-lactonase